MRNRRTPRTIALLMAAILAAGCSVHRPDDDLVAGDVEDVTAPGGAGSDGTGTDAGTVGGAGGSAGPDGGLVGGDSGVAGGGGSFGGSASDGGSAGSGGAGSGEPRRASDRGVTDTEIVLGILGTSEDFLTTLSGGSTKRHEEIIKPFIDEINANGGINGRKLVAKVSRYDPLSADSMQAACVQQAEDYKVFASIAQIGFYGDAEICMALKKTPLLTGNNSTAETNYEREKGWVRQTHQNKDRNAKIWIDWMIDSGLMRPGVKTGLLYVDVPEDRNLVRNVVLPYLKSRGMPEPQLAALSSNIAQTPSESQGAILRFRSEGVQLVLPLVSFLRMQIFTQEAEAAQYRPKYSVNDFGLMATDATAGFPAAQWNGVTGITVLRTGESAPGMPPNTPAYRECEAAYTANGGKLAPNPDDPSKPEGLELVNMMHYCQHIALFADAARRAGVNPTRESYLQALTNTGEWSKRVVLSERLTFGPKKYDGADLYAVVRWQAGCTPDGGCYRRVEGFKKPRW